MNSVSTARALSRKKEQKKKTIGVIIRLVHFVKSQLV